MVAKKVVVKYMIDSESEQQGVANNIAKYLIQKQE